MIDLSLLPILLLFLTSFITRNAATCGFAGARLQNLPVAVSHKIEPQDTCLALRNHLPDLVVYCSGRRMWGVVLTAMTVS